MDIRSALKRQYHAALKTLRIAIEKCPEAMWNDPADAEAPFWRVAYHTLFFANWYMQQDRSMPMAWPKHQRGMETITSSPCPPAPATREEILEFWDWCDAQVDAGFDKLNLDAAQCGFPWYQMPTLDHQIVNIRHIQHHAASLAMRLRRQAKVEVDWVGG